MYFCAYTYIHSTIHMYTYNYIDVHMYNYIYIYIYIYIHMYRQFACCFHVELSIAVPSTMSCTPSSGRMEPSFQDLQRSRGHYPDSKCPGVSLLVLTRCLCVLLVFKLLTSLSLLVSTVVLHGRVRVRKLGDHCATPLAKARTTGKLVCERQWVRVPSSPF